MRVRVTYAPANLCTPTQMANPYDGLKMTVEGDIQTVANWIDEHILAGHAALAAGLDGKCEYKQGHCTDVIVNWLRRGGTFDPVGGYSGLLLAEYWTGNTWEFSLESTSQ